MTTEPTIDQIKWYLRKLKTGGRPCCVYSVGSITETAYNDRWPVGLHFDGISSLINQHGFEFDIIICCHREPNKGCFIIPAAELNKWLVEKTLQTAKSGRRVWRLWIVPPDKIHLDKTQKVGMEADIDSKKYFKDTSQMCVQFPDLREWVEQNPPPKKSKKKVPAVNDTSNNATTATIPPQFKEIDDILAYKKQVILYGPPGTGKTFLANEYVESEYPNESERDKFVFRCTFHPEYGYEHFIEGYRPTVENRQMSFDLKSGIFKKLCEEAKTDPDNDFYLIIDEINRGDIPRIFGELITLIEADKRDQKFSTDLPLSQNAKSEENREKFWGPPNVYIIATMNTADRSIALLDTALRRRFGFHELKPDSSVFEKVGLEFSVPKSGESLAAWFDTLNKKLKEVLKEKRHDAEHILIGHSYFLQLKDLESEEKNRRFTQIIQHEILPLIQEYCYEDKEAREKLEYHIWETTEIVTDEEQATKFAKQKKKNGHSVDTAQNNAGNENGSQP